jgi:hypothetical protein
VEGGWREGDRGYLYKEASERYNNTNRIEAGRRVIKEGRMKDTGQGGGNTH